MRRAIFRPQPCDYPDEVARIVRVLADRGIEISADDARRAWEAESGAVLASWLMMQCQDDELAERVLRHCSIVDELNPAGVGS